MDTAHQWPQEIVVKPMEEIIQSTPPIISSSSSKPSSSSSSSIERKASSSSSRPQKDQALNCPRCNSTNTKFCYYNNYSLSQPRYFCKTCRRYWTAGGSLRNIPVGGGSRKNKRSSSSSLSSSSSSSSATSSSSLSSTTTTIANNLKNKIMLPDNLVGPHSFPLLQPHHHHHHLQNPNNKMIHEGQDLNLGFPPAVPSHHHHDFKTFTELIQVPNYENTNKENMASSSSSALELLTGMTSSSRAGLNAFIPMPPPPPPPPSSSSGFSLPPEMKSSLSFSLDALAGNNSNGFGMTSLHQGVHHQERQLLFPFEDLNSSHHHHQVSNNTSSVHHDHDNNHQNNNIDQNAVGDSNGYWSGVLGGGTW